MDATRMKVVWQISERDRRSRWTKIGVGLVNRDGSLALLLDVLPAGQARLQVRDYEPRDADRREAPDDDAEAAGAAIPATVRS